MQLDASVINSGFPCQSRVAFIGPFFPFEMKKITNGLESNVQEW